MDNEKILILISEIKGGNQESFELLLQKFFPIIRSHLKLYYAPGEDQDDFLQESGIAIWEAVLRYCPDKNVPFAAFAKVIVSRKIKSFLRARKRLKHIPLNEALSLNYNLSQFENERKLEDIIADNRYDPEQILFKKEHIKETKHKFDNFILKKMTPLEKKVFKQYIKNKSYTEIVNSTGYPYKTVDNALSRIRRKASLYFKQENSVKFTYDKIKDREKEIDNFLNMSNLEKIVYLEYLQGKKYYQIAEKLDISSKSVSNALSRVKQKMRSKGIEVIEKDFKKLTS